MRPPPRGSITRERGASLVVVLIVVTSLATAGALVLHLTVGDGNAVRHTVQRRAALYCAESGLAGARDYIGANVSSWGLMLDGDPSNDPAGYPPTGDLDGDGSDDWQVTIEDNDDEFPTDVPESDTDGVVFMVATCLVNTDTPRRVMQLVSVGGGGTNYRAQAGAGAGNTGNTN